MQCTEARARLDASGPHDDEIAEHLVACELCRRHAQDRRLIEILRSMDVPEPDPDFLAQAIRQSVSQPRTDTRRWNRFASAALFAAVCVLAASWLPSLYEQGNSQQAGSSASHAGSIRYVSVVIHSHQEQEAELTIALAENLELEGFAGQQELTWHARLSEGKNVLRVPLLVQGAGGELQVTSRFAGREHSVQVHVQAWSSTPPDSGNLGTKRTDESA